MTRTMLLIVALAALLASSAHPAERSSKVRREFQLAHPCPSTGATKGSCTGYVIDHIYPLCAGGKDEIANLQWQTVGDARRKDRVELALCRALRKVAALEKAAREAPRCE